MQYGSLNNVLMSNGNQTVTPEVGMGATQLSWTDRHAGTIVEVIGKATIVFQYDKATKADGSLAYDQDWKLERDPNERKITFTRRKNGAWVAKGQAMKTGTRIIVGVRDHHYDYSF